MDRRRVPLVLLLAFIACTGIAIVVSGSRPGPAQGVAPTVVQFVGYLLALVAAVLLVLGVAPRRRIGGSVLGSSAILVLLEVVLLDVVAPNGPDVGAGAVRLLCLVVIGVATVRLALDDPAARQTR
jgi:drug/metabolite transporter (DMT)-like permease